MKPQTQTITIHNRKKNQSNINEPKQQKRTTKRVGKPIFWTHQEWETMI